MSDINIKTVKETVDKIVSLGSPEMAVQDPELISEIIDIGVELEKQAEMAQELLLRSIDEESLVKLIFMCHKSAVATAMTNGEFDLVMADVACDLKSFTHTVVMSVIGMLYKEGVL